MSKYLEKLNGNGLFEEVESKTISMKSSYSNSGISSKEMKYEPNKIIYKSTKIERPKYQEDENTYEVLKPITRRIVELPVKVKKKIKTTKTVYRKEIIISNDQELNQILQEDLFKDVPLPSKSTIQNLMQDSMINSKIISSNNNINNDININNKNKKNTNNDIIINPIIYNSYNYYEQKNNKKEEMPKEKINIRYKNKNYIEEYFHDDDIPQPIVSEGNVLQFSELKESNNNQKEKLNKSISNLNPYKNMKKNLLNEFPKENKILSLKQPKIDKKENILYKSYNFEKTNNLNNKINLNDIYLQKDNQFRSQIMNYNNNINNKEINNNKNLNNSLKNNNVNKNGLLNNINESPLPEIDISTNNKNIYGTQIKMNKIMPKMELNYENKINDTNKIYNPFNPINKFLDNSKLANS